MINSIINLEAIQKKYKENYYLFENEFLKFQKIFFLNLQNEFKDLDAGSIILHFSRCIHEKVLKNQALDLQYDISFNNFINNTYSLEHKKKIIEISKEIQMPKETTRRKINDLIKLNILKKNKSRIHLMQGSNFLKKYEKFSTLHDDYVLKNLINICNLFNIKKTRAEIFFNFKKNYSFYIYIFLNNQIGYINIWKRILKDINALSVFIQFIDQVNLYAKKKYIFYEDHFFNKNIPLNKKDLCISNSSISNSTGIPRVTCMRKIKKLIKLKFIRRDNDTKTFFLNLNNVKPNKIVNFSNENNKIFEMNSNFYFLSLKKLLN